MIRKRAVVGVVLALALAAVLVGSSHATGGLSLPSHTRGQQGAARSLPVAQPAATPAPTRSPEPSPTAAATPTPAPLGADWAKAKPNELGRIMILEYHIIGPTESRWTRSYANFWNDLNLLYSKGYRPISLNDLIDNRIDVPAGFSPVVFTFDDSSPMQFAFVKGPDGTLVPDPNSAVGMLERFHALHPDWAAKATFFVLPGADHPHDLFGVEDQKQAKLQYLVDHGFEIGNHTFWHQRLDVLATQAQVEEQLGRAVQAIDAFVPGYNVRTLALPLGEWPKNPAWAIDGSYQGTAYHNDAILEDTGGPAPAPNSVHYNPFKLPRIQATNMALDFYKVYVDYLDQHPEERYVSDGNPDQVVFPKSLQQYYKAGAHDKAVALPADIGKDYVAIRVR